MLKKKVLIQCWKKILFFEKPLRDGLMVIFLCFLIIF